MNINDKIRIATEQRSKGVKPTLYHPEWLDIPTQDLVQELKKRGLDTVPLNLPVSIRNQ